MVLPYRFDSGKVFVVFPSQTYPILRVRKQSTETNDLRLQKIFLTQEMERQMLHFNGKRFLNRKKKQK